MISSWCAGAAILVSYLLGAVPFALVAGKAKGLDIRAHGSGNLGATNAIRVLGKPIGLTVFFLDFLKGLGPVILARTLPETWLGDMDRELLAFLCGVAAVVGHIFPIYLKFKGGKGVAALSGVLLAMRWDAALTAFVVFFVVRRLTGYVSLSSIALALAFPAAIFCYHPGLALNEYKSITWGSTLLAVLICVRHRANIVRIVKGEEPKAGRKKDKEVTNRV